MTERDYQRLLDIVQNAIETESHDFAGRPYESAPCAANDNGLEWALAPFPRDWHASS